MLNRRQFGIGAVAGSLSLSVPLSAARGGIAPLPAHTLRACNDVVADNARRLEWLARAVHRIEPLASIDRESAREWARLYEEMVDEAVGLHEKGITGRSVLERELLDWVSSIYPDADARARQSRTVITDLSGEYRAPLNQLEHDLSRHTHWDAIGSAWRVVALHPRTRGDMQAHRLAVEVLYSRADVFGLRYGRNAS